MHSDELKKEDLEKILDRLDSMEKRITDLESARE